MPTKKYKKNRLTKLSRSKRKDLFNSLNKNKNLLTEKLWLKILLKNFNTAFALFLEKLKKGKCLEILKIQA